MRGVLGELMMDSDGRDVIVDMEAVEEFCDRHALEIVAEVPYDRPLIDAERAGRAPVDYDPASPAVTAVRELTAKVV